MFSDPVKKTSLSPNPVTGSENTTSNVIADAFVPPVFAGLAKTVVEDWRSGNRVLERGLPRVHEQVSTWGVPLRWFGFVDLAERELSLRPGRRASRFATT